MFIDGIIEGELYNIEDVFGRDSFYYLNSTLRIIGWETPVSIIYIDGEAVRICYNKRLWDFSKDYTDVPYEGEGTVFDKAFEEEYIKEKHIRKLVYALKRYKEAGVEFKPVKLFPDELKEKLQSDEYFTVEGASVFRNMFGKPLNCHSLWLPVDVDAIITNDGSDQGNEAEIVFSHDILPQRIIGHVGYDGNFYEHNFYVLLDDNKNYFNVYSLDSGLKEIECKHKIKSDDVPGSSFLKSYVILPDGSCYDYDGEFCERETVHHKNVNLINKLIYKLGDFSKEIDRSHPYLTIKSTDMIYAFDIDFVEKLILPTLKSLNALSTKAYNDFIEIKKLIVYAGLSKDFGNAIQNVMELNKSKVFGGSGKGLASKRLIENLNVLKRRTAKRDFALLLNNVTGLKARIQKINKNK